MVQKRTYFQAILFVNMFVRTFELPFFVNVNSSKLCTKTMKASERFLTRMAFYIVHYSTQNEIEQCEDYSL